MSNLIIAGGRDFDEYMLLSEKVMDFICLHELEQSTTTIFHGDCEGADKLGDKFAKEIGAKIRVFPAAWGELDAKPNLIKTLKGGTMYNALAGLNRNTEMVKEATHLIAFWNGKSPGTKDIIDKAKKAGLIVETVIY